MAPKDMARFVPCIGRQWSLGSAGEHRLHTAGVTGSNPVATTMRQQVIGCFCRWPFFFPASGAPLGHVGGSSFEAREYEVKTLAVGLRHVRLRQLLPPRQEGSGAAAPVSLACRRLRHGKATAAACALRLAGRGLAGRRPPRPALPGSCPPPCRGLLCRRLLERGPSAKFNKRSASWAWRIARTCGKMLTVRATARAESRNAEACGNAGDAR